MSIVFYSAPMSSASPVGCALSELGVPHELVSFDLAQREHKKAKYLALNPNGVVPTLVVDGTPLFEALAILIFLGDRYGVDKGLWPAFDDPARLQAVSWCTWAYVTYGSTMVRLHHASGRVDPTLSHEPQAKLALEQLGDLVALLEARLTPHPYLLGEQFSLADLIVACVVGYSLYFGVSLDPYPRVAEWLATFQARPSFRSAVPDAA